MPLSKADIQSFCNTTPLGLTIGDILSTVPTCLLIHELARRSVAAIVVNQERDDMGGIVWHYGHKADEFKFAAMVDYLEHEYSKGDDTEPSPALVAA